MSMALQTCFEQAIHEEIRTVTFQVALVGTNGIVFASDRSSPNISPPSTDDQNIAIEPGEDRKFVFSEKRTLMCSFAGAAYSRSMAMRIAATEDTSDEALFKFGRESGINHQGNRDEFLILDRRKLDSILLVLRQGNDVPKSAERTLWVCAGNNSIPARFIPWHFHQKRPVADLENLALVTLLYAHEESPFGIGRGFDIVFLTKNGFSEPVTYELTNEEIGRRKRAFENCAVNALYGKESATRS